MKVKTLEATTRQLEYALRKLEGRQHDSVPFNMLAHRVQRQYEVSISYRDEYVCLSMWRSDIAMMYDQYAKKDKLDEAIVRIVVWAYVGNEIEIPEELL